jgi:hypothetical protein
MCLCQCAIPDGWLLRVEIHGDGEQHCFTPVSVRFRRQRFDNADKARRRTRGTTTNILVACLVRWCSQKLGKSSLNVNVNLTSALYFSARVDEWIP